MAEISLLTFDPNPPVQLFSEQQCSLDAQKDNFCSNSEAPVDSATQTCVLPHPDNAGDKKAGKEDQAKCDLTQLIITSDKNTAIIAPSTKGDALQIISGYDKNKKKLQCKVGGLIGPCVAHNNKIYDISFNEKFTNTTLDFSVTSVPFYKIFDTGKIFPWEPETTDYTVIINTCGHSISKQIIIYPDISLSIDIPLQLSPSKEETENLTNSKKNFHVHETPQEGYSVKAMYSEDGHEWTIKPSITEKFKKIKDFVKVTDTILMTFRKAFDDTIKLTFLYPTGTMHFDFAWKNKKEVFKVGTEWHAQINIDPFIGASITLELDELFLEACSGPVGKLYAKIKKALADHDVKIGLELIVTGTISIECGFKKEVDEEESIKTGAGVKGKVEGDLKATASIDIQIIISVDATLEAGLKTGVELSGGLYSSDSELSLDLTAKFLGVKYYWTVNVSGGTTRKKKKKGEDTDTDTDTDTDIEDSALICPESEASTSLKI